MFNIYIHIANRVFEKLCDHFLCALRLGVLDKLGIEKCITNNLVTLCKYRSLDCSSRPHLWASVVNAASHQRLFIR